MAPQTIFPDEFRLLSPVGLALSGGLLVVFLTTYILSTLIYNIFFHPLKHIPGPFWARASPLPHALHMRNGTIAQWTRAQHAQHGAAVRLSPREVSFISGETAWPDIYGFRTGKHKNTGPYLKDMSWYLKPVNGVPSLISSDESAHSRMRRNLAHAFSDRALRGQEGLVQRYVDLLVHRIGEQGASGKGVDIMRWYNFTTFDVICDLTFGEPLYCLRDSKDHHWIKLVINAIKAVGTEQVRRNNTLFSTLDKIQSLLTDTSAMARGRKEFLRLVHDKVERRLEQGSDARPDFMSSIIKNQEVAEKALTRDELDSNAMLFLVAGSETTATTLTGVTYLLLSHPEKYQALVREVRGKFDSMEQITIEEVNKMEYMIACLQEGLRYYPPVPTGFPRVVPPGGDYISGHYVPGGTSVYVAQHASNHSTRNFTDPEYYVPERWLGGEKYKDDVREVVNPFSFGPRNCLGKNLAYAEMRLILAKVLFSFDLELVDKGQEWMEGQRVYTLWDKPSLFVRAHPVKR